MSKISTIHFNEPALDIRLDKYLTQAHPQLSRSYIHKLIEQGYILVDGRRAKASQKLNASDMITIELPPPPSYPSAEPISLTIIYEDNDALVVDKPAGLTVHPAPGHPNHTLVNALLAHCPSLAKSDDLIRPGIVHRLDKDTSGLMVVVKNDFARRCLISQFQSRTITKRYIALVKGKLSPEQGTIEAPIGRNPRNRKKMAVVKEGKEASTQYQVKRYLGNYTLIEAILNTGRTHQIRVHLSSIGHPVLGDPVYGVKSPYLNRQFIHAYLLGFRLPSTNEYREFTCPLPQELQQVLESLAYKV